VVRGDLGYVVGKVLLWDGEGRGGGAEEAATGRGDSAGERLRLSSHERSRRRVVEIFWAFSVKLGKDPTLAALKSESDDVLKAGGRYSSMSLMLKSSSESAKDKGELTSIPTRFNGYFCSRAIPSTKPSPNSPPSSRCSPQSACLPASMSGFRMRRIIAVQMSIRKSTLGVASRVEGPSDSVASQTLRRAGIYRRRGGELESASKTVVAIKER
jgi:hypothetical protein